MNIYSPREYSNKKAKFFNNIIDIIENNTGKNVVLGVKSTLCKKALTALEGRGREENSRYC